MDRLTPRRQPTRAVPGSVRTSGLVVRGGSLLDPADGAQPGVLAGPTALGGGDHDRAGKHRQSR
ncbi:hypothetical protein [Micromonospora zingiberis]|uniref:hypothetical protein n=1 Tax=Micromonospora zingiberis TaxID=2053011 RepID=UPI001F10E5BB|nr:hypothetical protein [Micromonospora zingiberis]